MIKIYVEGGAAEGKDTRSKCKEGYSTWVAKLGVQKKPRFISCGGRQQAFEDFSCAIRNKEDDDIILLWVDTEDYVEDFKELWELFRIRDHWSAPAGVTHKQVVVMRTCMETWLVSDHNAISALFGSKIKTSLLPGFDGLEMRPRNEVYKALVKATNGKYTKGKTSFELLSKTSPSENRKHCQSAERAANMMHSICGKV